MKWTTENLRLALRLTADDVIIPTGANSAASRREWALIQTAQRLVEAHGVFGALVRLNGEDPADNADRAAWAKLGRRAAA